MTVQPTIGFACAWDRPPEGTWSHTPWHLRAALRQRTRVVDLGLEWTTATRSVLRLLGAYRRDGRWRTNWTHRRLTMALTGVKLRAAERRLKPDVAVQIGDLALLDTPFLLYQDVSFDVVLEHPMIARARGLSPREVNRLRDRQHAIYARAAGLMTMSHWLAEHLVRVSGVPAERVHVVPPGANCVPADPTPADRPSSARREPPRRRLLFVGKDFFRKGGDLVVAALEILRREVDPRIELTVAGPDRWPLPGPVPDGVRFLGQIPLDRVGPLYREHDLFVMPSRFEGYGIAFVEALAHGVPCVARRKCAMPEIVRPGVNGALIGSDDAAELARAIAGVLADDDVYARTEAAAPDVVSYYSWSRVADDVLRVAAAVR